MVKLGVNIDHVATLRQARKAGFPSPVEAARICELAGADSITVHLREDRRHIQDSDVTLLRQSIKTKLNLEMSVADEIVNIAVKLLPDEACIVPEKRQELTTEGGLDILAQKEKIAYTVAKLKGKGIVVSLFINPDKAQIKAAKDAGADCVELHTGKYAELQGDAQKKELKRIVDSSKFVLDSGLILNAGHGLDYANTAPVARINGMSTLNIGFSIISKAMFVGLTQAVKDMKNLIK